MKWLNVLREGATRAADKAQRTVEVTKLAAQISGKRRLIRDVQRQIGAAVHEANKRGDFTAARPEVTLLSAHIDGLERQIGVLELELQRLNREKTCPCGRIVPFSARYCPDCGKPFVIRPETVDEALEVEASLHCIRCDAEMGEDDKYCFRCGSDQSEDGGASARIEE
ncbi:zinc ribbon domain-containing protein [Paenibacillus ginsengarvi]|uniref:Uncharacterized protein n=1 Tax=Paenibacillus ginsengarvi TaxID=400777 RepID=A0A3B0CDC8_9BACL|nr:zinc ribbon domain-containing protein [Paenibacillus ginsengarvi]RKN83873.1 hypothetical protein D7M11_16940 [Paenibacillus ginsengarvi]